MFICVQCGYQSVKWLGRCPGCGQWESFSEKKEEQETDDPLAFFEKSPPKSLSQVTQDERARLISGLGEFDRVLGGGIVQGEVVLVGGEPGTGKSTLLLQVAALYAKKKKVLYVSAEESRLQISLRAQRLGIRASNLYMVNEDDLFTIHQYIRGAQYDIIIIDSIQVMYNPKLGTARGSPNQVRNCAEFLTRLAKLEGISLFIIGHVTKEGLIAGPKLLEHIVDCVLYFEPETLSHYKVLRASKNRFGSTGEIAVFEMTAKGLQEVEVLSDIFLPHKDSPVAGSSIACVAEGAKPLLIELQALVAKSSFGMVRRRSLGFDFNRFSLLIATVEKRLKITLSGQDVFLNVAGGIRVNDPAADLAVVLSIFSSYKDKKPLENTVYIGEVGLVGELRPVSDIALRLKEVAKGGFKRCFIPKGNSQEIKAKAYSFGIEQCGSVKEVLERLKEHP